MGSERVAIIATVSLYFFLLKSLSNTLLRTYHGTFVVDLSISKFELLASP